MAADEQRRAHPLFETTSSAAAAAKLRWRAAASKLRSAFRGNIRMVVAMRLLEGDTFSRF
jgi:hypothetical protein